MSVYELSRLIKTELRCTGDSFVSIGYYLKQIRDRKLYEETGHKDIWEFAQDQFGISKSSASRFMSINDKFSVDGNSPELLEEFKDFSSSKLSEMLTLSDKQLKQANPDMTREQIRDMKPKKVSVIVDEQIPGQVNIEDYPEVVPATPIDELDLSVRTYNTLVRGGITTVEQLKDKTDEELAVLRNMSKKQIEEIKGKLVAPAQQEPESHYCKEFGYECNLEERRAIAKDLGCDCIASCCCKCDEMPDCGAACFVATDRKSKRIKDAEDHVQISNTPLRPEIKGFMSDPYCPKCDSPLEYRCNCECGQVIDWIQVAPLFEFEEEQIEQRINEKVEEHIKNNVEMLKGISKVDVIQPELPLLKNNDQRKDWIDAYQTWPVWIDQELTGERYYKYDLDNGVSFVVKVSTCHKWSGGNGYNQEVEYGREKYYIIGRECTENYRPKHPTFSESEENKSAMIEYLKGYQKGEK